MSFKIIWDQRTKDFLKKLDKTDAQRIIKKVNTITSDPIHYFDLLVDIKIYKLRVGDYRVLVDIDQANKNLIVIIIGHRKDIYKNLQNVFDKQ